MINLSDKQKEYIANATHRWNIKTGSVRSGKSFCDVAAVIPYRLITLADKPGLNFILGVSRESIERNVLESMRAIYGEHRVGFITSSTNTATLFGQTVYCIGAEKINQVGKIEGASVK